MTGLRIRRPCRAAERQDAWSRFPAPRETRPVWIDGAAQAVPVYERLRLPIGASINGPALFEQSDTTVWLEPGFVAQVDALGNLLLRRVA